MIKPRNIRKIRSFWAKVCIKDKKALAILLYMHIDMNARKWYNNSVIQREQKHSITIYLISIHIWK